MLFKMPEDTICEISIGDYLFTLYENYDLHITHKYGGELIDFYSFAYIPDEEDLKKICEMWYITEGKK